MTNHLLRIVAGWLLVSSALAQQPTPMAYHLEVGGFASSDNQLPFWLRTNQHGVVPLQGPLGTARLGITRSYRQPDSSARKKRRFDWGFGLNAVANLQLTNQTRSTQFFLPEAYVKVRIDRVELSGGNRINVAGIADSSLSSGAVAWSGNALPIPTIQLHTPDFVPLGFTKNTLAFRVGYAHGWFVNTYIHHSYLHQKYAYIRLGKPRWKIQTYAGINHQVQWGGRADYLIGTDLAVNGKLPTAFRDYLSMVIGHYPDALQNDRFTGFDGTNRIGNHLGSIDLAIEWKRPAANWMLYHQHLYEDASGLAFLNVPDGLTGLRFRRTAGSANRTFTMLHWVLEWLSTTNQSGPTFDPTARFQGSDNYFNHSQYRQGWSYQGQTLGTPFLMPYTELNTATAQLGGAYFPTNRVIAWYTAAEGRFGQGPTLTVRLSYSRNLGTFNQPYPAPRQQLSAGASARWPFNRHNKTHLTTSLAFDQGQLLPVIIGGFVGLRRDW